MLNRRNFIKSVGAVTAGASIAGGLSGCVSAGGSGSNGHVVIIGGGYGGATAAKYLRMWSNRSVKVTLIERESTFVSCPISNLVIGGIKDMAYITTSYDNLRNKWGVKPGAGRSHRHQCGQARGHPGQRRSHWLRQGHHVARHRLSGR